jgi:hypothetical protein
MLATAQKILPKLVLGFVVDDDNEPAPENIPAPQDNNNLEATDELQWGWGGIDHRKQANCQATRAGIMLTRALAMQRLLPEPCS